MFHWLVGFCRRQQLRMIVFAFSVAIAPVLYVIWVTGATHMPRVPVPPIFRQIIDQQGAILRTREFDYFLIASLSAGLVAVLLLWWRIQPK